MQKDDDTSKSDLPKDDIAWALKTDEPTERKPGELERSNRVGAYLAGMIRQEAAVPGEVTFDRTATKQTIDQPLWVAIRNRTRAIGFNRYNKFINAILSGDDFDKYDLLDVKDKDPEFGEPELNHRFDDLCGRNALKGIGSYNLLKLATEAFHNLLQRTALFYRQDDDITAEVDAVPLLNALREVHIILAEGAHNQYGDLPWTARREMLIIQWLLGRQETKEFLRGRSMVPYPGPWMGAVDDMKRLHHWGDVSVTHFHELAKFGEQILLSIRFGDWSDINDQELARNWARYWRPEIQSCIQAYNILG